MIDSWASGNGIMDTTIIPHENIITPQLGIVYIGILITFIVSNAEQMLFILSSLSFVAMLLSFLFIYKILKEFGIEKFYRNCILLSLCIPINLFNIYLQPLNDTFFLFLSTLSIYLIILWNKNRQFKYLIILFGLSIVISVFRIQGSIIFLSTFLVAFIHKRFYDSLVYLSLSLITFLSNDFILKLFNVNVQGIKELSILTFSKYSFTYFIDKIFNTFHNILPSLIIGDPARITIVKYLIFIILFYVCSMNFKQIKKTYFNFNYLLILLIVINNILFFQFFVQVERYLISILPLILILLYKTIKLEFRYNIVILYVLMGFSTSIVRAIDTVFYNYTFKQNKLIKVNSPSFLPKNYNLISEHPRLTYFLFNKKSVRKSVRKIDSNEILIIGYERNLLSTIDNYIGNREYSLTKIPYKIRRNRNEYYTLNIVSLIE